MQENTLIYLQNIQLLFSVYIIPKNTNVPTTCPCFPALPGFSVFRIFCKSLRWSLHEELHHSDREEIRHPQLPDWSHRRQLRNGFVFRPWPRHIKSAEPELFTLSLTKPFFFCHLSLAGNLLVVAFVSYFGAKLHRPRLIAIGCVIMALGSYLVTLPHFLQGLLVQRSLHVYHLSCFL